MPRLFKLLTAAALGLFLAGRFPKYEPVMYVPEISDGKIGVVFPCAFELQAQFEEAMRSAGAEQVKLVEAKTL